MRASCVAGVRLPPWSDGRSPICPCTPYGRHWWLSCSRPCSATVDAPACCPFLLIALTRSRNDSRCLDLDSGPVLDERRHLHQRHRGEMTADHPAIHLAHLARSREVLPLVGDVPRE